MTAVEVNLAGGDPIPDPAGHRAWLERAFGEEYARAMCDLDPSSRRDYFAWMLRNGLRYGVPEEPSYSVAWLLEVEDEVRREHPELFPRS